MDYIILGENILWVLTYHRPQGFAVDVAVFHTFHPAF
jgi:hypothetical protein